MKKALLKDSLKQIAKTNKRFISILLMAFMGVGFFAGVRSASPDMKATIDTYYDNKNMYDISLVSTLGLSLLSKYVPAQKAKPYIMKKATIDIATITPFLTFLFLPFLSS